MIRLTPATPSPLLHEPTDPPDVVAELLVSSDHLSRIAFANPGAVIEYAADRAFCTVGRVAFVAVLGERVAS